MAQPQGGAGVNLRTPAYLYPAQLNNAAPSFANPLQDLGPGDAVAIPPGQQFISPGAYSFIQSFDPVTQSWRGFSTARVQPEFVWSDGVNYRVANLTGCPVAAIVVAGGSGYTQANTTVTANTGGSTWQPIVGGMVSVTTIANAGSGYGVAPLILIPDPPSPGVPATGYATITGGSVTGVTLTNVGAGYISAPTITVIPSPYDLTAAGGTVVPATVTTAIIGSGSVTAVICTNNGAPASPTLTVASATGTTASVVAVVCQTLSSVAVVGGGTGLTGGAGLITIGGTPSAVSQWTNPAISLTNAIPRPAEATFASTGGSLVSISTIYDSGLFFTTGNAPNLIVEPYAGYIQATAGSVTATMGSTPDTMRIQQM